MTAFTVAMREKGKTATNWLYVSDDLSIQDTTLRCKPLSREEAGMVRRVLIDLADKKGRPIECRIVRLTHVAE